MDKIRIGIIGCGGMARAHASRFSEVLDRIEVSAVVDIEPERAQAVADLLDTWSAHLQGSSWIRDPAADHAPAEANLLHLDSSLAHSTLGWQPRFDFQTAVTETAAWYDAWRHDADLRALTIEQIKRHSDLTWPG